MSEIMRCVFERREPVRNVTALALMQYVCEEFPRSRVDVWRAYFADPTKPDFAFEHIQAHGV